ncbi:MAG: virulence RhuM family protein [Eggerthellaceae bacterium]|nr:virulence RhuM family protein [Eggerthellaceae bacterium]
MRSDGGSTLYDLDVVISVGYHVKSQRGVKFRRWATDVLRRYIVDGHAENEKRLAQLGKIASIMAEWRASCRASKPRPRHTQRIDDTILPLLEPR